MIRTLPLVLLVLVIAACQKNDSSPLINNDGPLLKTFYHMDATPSDTFYRMTYTYDTRNRVQSATKKTYVFLLQQSWFQETYDSAIYYYSGDQVLPYRKQNLYYDLNHILITEKNTYYTYDGTGLLTKDSSFLQFQSNYEKDVTTFKYSNDIIWTEITKNTTGSVQKDSLKTRILPCGNNLCEQYDTLYLHPYTQGYQTRRIKMTFDGSVNPFYAAKMRFPTWLRSDHDIRLLFEENAFFKNNLVGLDYAGNFDNYSIVYHADYTYTKNSLDAPVTESDFYNQTAPGSHQFRHYGYYYY